MAMERRDQNEPKSASQYTLMHSAHSPADQSRKLRLFASFTSYQLVGTVWIIDGSSEQDLAVAAAVIGTTPLVVQSAGMAFEGDLSTLPEGEYRLDSAHSTLVFKVSHLGFSFYTATFTQFDVDLTLDPKDVKSASLTTTID